MFLIEWAEVILQPFRCFTHVTVHCPTFLRLSYVTSPSLNSPELIIQTFRHFTYVTTYSRSLPSLYLQHSSFSNPSVASPTSQFNLQPFFLFFYVTCSSLNEFYSFSNLSVTSPTSQLILQPFRRFTYATAHTPTLPLLHLRHSSFSNPSFVSPTSQALHLNHLASRPWIFVKTRK